MTARGSSRLRVRGLVVELGGARVLDGVDLDLAGGELVAIVGPNGAGKSSVLGAVVGDLDRTAGSIELDGEAVERLTVRETARRRALLLQQTQLAFGFRVRDVVAMGRTPWHRTAEQEHDADVVEAAMRQCDVRHLAERLYPTLSGGERARASLARVLAQRTPVLLLDEPTAALDIRHQEQVLAIAHGLATEGCGVAVVLHDLSLAAAYADRVVLLDRGRVRASGPPAEVLTPALLGEVYDHPVDVVHHAGRLLVVPVRGPAVPTTREEPASCVAP